MRAERDGHGADAVGHHVRPAHFVPETKRLTALLREMQDREVPPVDRGRRVRRHRRPGHPRGPDRGARRRDRRRVRRRGADGRAARPTAASWSPVGWPSTTPTTSSTPSCRRGPGHRRRPAARPGRPRPEPRGGGRGRRLPAGGPAGRRAAGSGGCGSSGTAPGRRHERRRRLRALRRPTVRSGFATIVGRPNVGKSTLVNAMVGTKVSITSPRPNTTRHNVRGILHRPDAQVVFVDTPGPPPAPDRPRASGSTRPPRLPRRRRRGRGHGRRHRAIGSGRPHRPRPGSLEWPPGATTGGLLVAVNKIDRARTGRSSLRWPRSPRPWTGSSPKLGQRRDARTSSTSRCRPVPARASMRWSTPSWPGCPRARRTTPTTWSPTPPKPSGWPSWCASSCCAGPARSCPTPSPAG